MWRLISTGTVIGKKVCKVVAIPKIIVKILSNNVSKGIHNISVDRQCLRLQISLGLLDPFKFDLTHRIWGLN